MKYARLSLLGIALAIAFVLWAPFGWKKAAGNRVAPREAPPSSPTLIPPSRPAASGGLPVSGPIARIGGQSRQAAEVVNSIYTAPITFYGKVQDQSGQPVSEALVDYSIVDQFFAPGSKKSGFSDSKGDFSLIGAQGAALTVGVSKDGYDPIYQQSNGSFAFGVPFDSGRDRPTPSKDNPAIFVLRKKTAAEHLVRIKSHQHDVAKNGTPAEINLETGGSVGAGKGNMRVEFWVDDQVRDTQGRFNWKCRVSIPEGGLIDRDPERDFTAPEAGYRDADEIVTENVPGQHWSSEAKREYFVKIAHERYARIKFTAYAGARTFFVMESYLNPSGSRNLEYDPNLRK